MASERVIRQAFWGVSALVFAASATLTILWCKSMSGMEMPMPGGWTMSMTWMGMMGQTWLSAAAAFTGMWVIMMIAMMLPSLLPMLRRYRVSVGTSEARLSLLTALVGAGYFFAWTLWGVAVFASGVILAQVEMRHPSLARAVPIIAAAVVLIAGLFQFTSWKARH